MKKAVIATIVFLLILASPILVNAASGKIFSPEEKPDLTKGTDADAETCVLPVGGNRDATKDFMRVNHMKELKDGRVKYVREGHKDERRQLERCFSCHTYEDFCQECHKYNGVEPGCMDKTNGCHSTEEQPVTFRPDGL